VHCFVAIFQVDVGKVIG